LIDESAITAVTGGTRVLSDRIKVWITAGQGSTFLDRMIRLVGGAARQKTPNEIALNILLARMPTIFLLAAVTIPSFASYAGGQVGVVVLIALFVTLIPTTIGALPSAIGIAGMDRLVKFNVLAMSGRAVEAAGDVDTLLLDKTGTITLGNRVATELILVAGDSEAEMADAAQLASLSDETPRGPLDRRVGQGEIRSAGARHGPVQCAFRAVHRTDPDERRRSRRRVDPQGRGRCGADLYRLTYIEGTTTAPVGLSARGGGTATLARPTLSPASQEIGQIAGRIAQQGGTPLAVARNDRLLGVIHLKDIVNGGVRERFAELCRAGNRTVMITGDNPLTAAAIAAEAGVDGFLAQAMPEDELKLIRKEQAEGKLVAICGVRRRH
jgi:K+-transporting ATPase ATPase B chain